MHLLKRDRKLTFLSLRCFVSLAFATAGEKNAPPVLLYKVVLTFEGGSFIFYYKHIVTFLYRCVILNNLLLKRYWISIEIVLYK